MPTLHWLTRQNDLQTAQQVPYHLLNREAGYGDPMADNMLIHGDNLLALKALLPYYAGQVKCIFIDPPYNTRSAFAHYEDNLEHSQWLGMMLPRLQLLRELLAEDGSLWVTLDDNEAHYFKVLADEVFGRKNFVANVVWEKSDSPKMDSKLFSSRHDHLMVYSKCIDLFSVNRILWDEEKASHYNKTDKNGNKYYTKPLRAMGSGEDTREARPSMYFPLIAPDGNEVFPKKPDGSDGRWRWGLEKTKTDSHLIEWVKTKNGWSAYYKIYQESSSGRPPETIFTHVFSGSNRTAKQEVKNLFNEENSFITPKPERLLQRVFEISTNENELILDSFLGCGTTAAVAHKMGRRYIGIELGDHARTHCLPRLQKVIDGEQGGISQAVGWQGGGGFGFYTLGAPVFDADGHISPDVRFSALAAHVWFLETRTPLKTPQANTPCLGLHDGTAYILLFNGILGDRSPNGGNVLTRALWQRLKAEALAQLGETPQKWVIYGESCRLTTNTLQAENITFKQTPYDINTR